jgi:hypothetical protein
VATIISAADLAVEHDRPDSLQHRLGDAGGIDLVLAARHPSPDISDVR